MHTSTFKNRSRKLRPQAARSSGSHGLLVSGPGLEPCFLVTASHTSSREVLESGPENQAFWRDHEWPCYLHSELQIDSFLMGLTMSRSMVFFIYVSSVLLCQRTWIPYLRRRRGSLFGSLSKRNTWVYRFFVVIIRVCLRIEKIPGYFRNELCCCGALKE